MAIYGLENHQGTPVYVHAKVCVMDDTWATVGSDNFNRRSWTHDSELSAVVVDPSAADHSPYARHLRLQLAAEHLDRETDGSAESLLEVMADCVDPRRFFEAYAATADRPRRLARRRRGRRAPARSPAPAAAARPGAARAGGGDDALPDLHDPDGRPRGLKRLGGF